MEDKIKDEHPFIPMASGVWPYQPRVHEFDEPLKRRLAPGFYWIRWIGYDSDPHASASIIQLRETRIFGHPMRDWEAFGTDEPIEERSFELLNETPVELPDGVMP